LANELIDQRRDARVSIPLTFVDGISIAMRRPLMRWRARRRVGAAGIERAHGRGGLRGYAQFKR
jgi:hypothetical protein